MNNPSGIDVTTILDNSGDVMCGSALGTFVIVVLIISNGLERRSYPDNRSPGDGDNCEPLSDDFLDHTAVYISQAIVTALVEIRQLLMVEPHKM